MDSPASKALVEQLKNLLKVFNPAADSPYRIQKEEEGPNNLAFLIVNSEKKIELQFQHVMVGHNKRLLLLTRIHPKGAPKAAEQQFVYDFEQEKWVNKEGSYLSTVEMGTHINRKL